MAYAWNLSTLQFGLKPTQAAVPLLLSTGNLLQFAWATTLDPLFPLLNVTSRVFDISFLSDLLEASKALARAKMFCRELAGHVKQCGEPDESSSLVPSLNKDLYHIKDKSRIFNRYDDGDSIGDDGLAYLWQIFEAPKDVEEAVKPFGYAKTLKGQQSAECLIFSKLDATFRMGVPQDKILFDGYLIALSNVVKRQHRARVVHVDLYPSNILWKDVDDSLIIRIIDWDAATFIGDAFTAKIGNVFLSEEKKNYYWKPSLCAEPKCDAWFVYILSRLNEQERMQMQSNDNVVNRAYQSAVERLLKDAGSREALHDEFEIWYVNWDSGAAPAMGDAEMRAA